MGKSLVVWADDDWNKCSIVQLKKQIVEGFMGVLHYSKKNCYEGLPRKVRITIQELPTKKKGNG